MMDARPLDAAIEVLSPVLAAGEPTQALIAAKCAGLLHGYAARWELAPYRVLDVERTVTGGLYNVDTNAGSRTFSLAGKIDVRAEDRATGERVLLDHKTASQDIMDPSAPYWRQLAVEGQASHYFLLEWQRGERVGYAVWDAVRKPSISPKLLAKKDRAAVLEERVYCGFVLSSEELEAFAEGERETLRMYAMRLADDAIRERPQWYYQRRQVPRLDAEIHEYAQELWGHAQDLILARRQERHPRNSGACMLYGTPCKYLGICSGFDTPDSPHWARKPNVHAELPELAGDGRDVLTTSRVRCFQTCRRKHFYQYELGIERFDEEEREALYFGTLFHNALEQYFLTLKKTQN